LGVWIRKLRHITTEVRSQTGIDDLLRAEGFSGGLNELRTLLRDQHHYAAPLPSTAAPLSASLPAQAADDPYAIEVDATREYPLEGVDAYTALADDLLDDDPAPAGPIAATPFAIPKAPDSSVPQ
jgi:sec-independent protein translocase protein TatB